MSNINFNCDVCGREVQGYTFVNGMKFCAKCYQETFGNNTNQFVDLLNKEMYELKIANLEKQVTDLQQQLAEKEKLEYTDTIKFVETSEPNVVANELDRLNKQLTEKEKAIKTMQESSDKNIDYLIEFTSLIKNPKDCNRMLKALEKVRTGKKYIVDKEHQNKISFAVEALKIAQKYVKQYVNNFDDMNDCLCAIDNQIKQLKEMK